MMPLLILLLFGSFTLSSPVKTEKKKIIVISSDEGDIKSKLDYEAVYDLAKNISYSKGIYSKEGKLRRSVMHKVEMSSSINIVREILMKFESDINKIDLLDELEFLVHGYGVAIYFSLSGGIQIISPHLFSSDNEIAASVALVLGAAMQSNPTVQQVAMEQHTGRKFFYLLSHTSPMVLSRIIFALSALLRNFPDAQYEFLIDEGFSKFKAIFTNYQISVNTKLKIVNLLGDLAVELETSQHEKKPIIHRLFINAIKDLEYCEVIFMFLELEDYDTHRKVLSAMVSLQDICYQEFKDLGIHKQLERVTNIYFSNKFFVALIDFELFEPLMNDVKALYRKFPVASHHTYPNTTFFRFNDLYMRDEL